METGGRRTGAWSPGGWARPVRRGGCGCRTWASGGDAEAGARRPDGRRQERAAAAAGCEQQEPRATATVMQGSRDWPCEQEVVRRQGGAQAKKMRPRVTRAGFIGYAGG
jgi:hypothetical protein